MGSHHGPSREAEDSLVAQARSGSREAMVELYHRHKGLVIGYVLRMTGDRDLADEVFAGTFAAFFGHLDRYRARGALGAYLIRIARGRLADEARARNRLGRRLVGPSAEESGRGEPVDPSPGPAESTASAELAGLAGEALSKLSPPLREVVVLRLYEGLDYAAIALIVGAGEATVRSRMRYALQSLRRSMDVSRDPESVYVRANLCCFKTSEHQKSHVSVNPTPARLLRTPAVLAYTAMLARPSRGPLNDSTPRQDLGILLGSGRREFIETESRKMTVSRRGFLGAASVASALVSVDQSEESTAVRSRDGGAVPVPPAVHKPLINHVGYRPVSAKYVVAVASPGETFQVWAARKKSDGPVLQGEFALAGDDFGPFAVGDFSTVREPGYYRVAVPSGIESGGGSSAWSQDFRVDDAVWDPTLGKLVDYYRAQSCGKSRQGYNTPCHAGPIPRLDGGPAVPITGGWHSAHDHVRDLPEILHGLFGLLALARSRPRLAADLSVFEEVRHGNDYFLQIQDPKGFACFGVYAADYFGPADWWASGSYNLRTEPAPLYCQHQFMAAQSLIAATFKEAHPDYAGRCLVAAVRCFEACRSLKIGDPGETRLSYGLGTGAYAGAMLFEATRDKRYADYASAMADELVELQDSSGYWPERVGGDLPPSSEYNLVNARYLYGPYVPLGLASAARAMPNATGRDRWLGAVVRFTSGFVKTYSAANAFGLLPVRITRSPRPGARQGKEGSYRYFTDSNQRLACPGTRDIPWQTGSTANVCGLGVALLEVGRLLGDSSLHALAQRQLDWIMGSNPSDASCILGVGHNQPATYPAHETNPTVPDIIGAVLQGHCGDDLDRPFLSPGDYRCCEYWLPHHSWALWLMADPSDGS